MKIQTDTVIPVKEFVATLPDFTDKELVIGTCIPCHSLQYIATQPNMTRKKWETIVTKMVKNYGAPVQDSSTVHKIVDYLF